MRAFGQMKMSCGLVLDLDLAPEYFSPRGVGTDGGFPCLITGKPLSASDNISGFVRSREAGKRVVAMLGGRARLDWREWEPSWIQVKLGVEGEHLSVLTRLFEAVVSCDSVINPRLIAWAIDPTEFPSFEPAGLRQIRLQKERIAAIKQAVEA